MTLPKNIVKPNFNYTYPSERQYFDDTNSTLAVGIILEPTKSGADYGIQDQRATKPIQPDIIYLAELLSQLVNIDLPNALGV
jgi:hypothetical protein